LEVVATAIYLLNFLLWIVYVPGYRVDYSGRQSPHKNYAAPAPPPELLAFLSLALAAELSFFTAPAPDSGRFQALIFC